MTKITPVVNNVTTHLTLVNKLYGVRDTFLFLEKFPSLKTFRWEFCYCMKKDETLIENFLTELLDYCNADRKVEECHYQVKV